MTRVFVTYQYKNRYGYQKQVLFTLIGCKQPSWVNNGLHTTPGSNELDGDEDIDYKHLTVELCQFYSHTSRDFTIIDTKNPVQLYF
jgi:hypothetical protein